MTRIEEALSKIRGAVNRGPALGQRPRRSAVPVAAIKTDTSEGDRHHVSPTDLINGGLLPPLDKVAQIADEFRKIKRPLLMNSAKASSAGEGMNVIMIASAMPGAGKTFCAVNLAQSISLERDLKVLLVDADVLKPQISRAFGLGDAPGLIELLLDEPADASNMLVRTDFNDILVLPAGRMHAQATELLASERMSQIVQELATRYQDRIVLVDSPPLLLTAEAQVLASHVGQIALVVEAGETSHQMLAHSLETLDRSKPINLILNKMRRFVGDGYGYYAAHYGQYGNDRRT